MNLNDLLKQHQDILDKAKTSMTARVVTPADLKRMPAINTQRIAAVTARSPMRSSSPRTPCSKLPSRSPTKFRKPSPRTS